MGPSSLQRFSIVPLVPVALALAVGVGWATEVKAQACTPDVAGTYIDTFDNTTYKHDEETDPRGWTQSVSGWRAGVGGGTITLNSKRNSFNANTDAVGKRLKLVGAADFDNDGLPDLIGLMMDPTCHLHFLTNRGVTDGEHDGFYDGGSGSSFNARSFDGTVNCSDDEILLVGDFDGDGDADIFYSDTGTTESQQRGRLEDVRLYENTSGPGTPGSIPNFASYKNVTSTFASARMHYLAQVATVVDWNKDGRDDIVIGNGNSYTNGLLVYYGRSDLSFTSPTTLLNNVGTYTPIADTGTLNQRLDTSICGTGRGAGVTAIAIEDFDGDNDRDIIAGSLSDRNLVYWVNDGTGVFTRRSDIAFPQGGPTLLVSGDFDDDGDVDLVVGRNGWTCGGTGGRAYFYENNGTGSFTQHSSPIADAGDDLDFGISLDIDGNGIPDYVVADGNHSGAYYVGIALPLPIYALSGEGWSKQVSTTPAADETIASVDVTLTIARDPPDTDLRFYISNDDGQNWQAVSLPNGSGTFTLSSLEFNTYGNRLRWKVEMTAQPDSLDPEYAAFAPAAEDTPRLQDVRITYYTVPRRWYSRSTTAIGYPLLDGEQREVIYGASFLYPGFQGEVRALDITDLPMGEGPARIDTDTTYVKEAWDAHAGEQLSTRTVSRTLYAGYAAGSSGPVNDRLRITSGELTSPSTNPSLQTMMALNESTKYDTLDFLINGMGDEDGWKYYDPGHSSPVFVGAPKQVPSVMGDGYEAFKAANSNRTSIVYIGSNDGLLRAFNASTGHEEWGYLPYNLLAKWKEQYDEAGRYEHHDYIDGWVRVADYKTSGGTWKTAAIVGQARGQGRADNNYYFALDITDPSDPQPLWEFTDGITLQDSCDGERCETTTVPCSPICTDSCADPDHVFDQQDGVIIMEAEHFNNKFSIGSHNWVEQSSGSASGNRYMQALSNNGTNCNGNINTCGARMDFDIAVYESTTFYPWFRTRANSGSDDSVTWGIDGSRRQAQVSTSTSGSWAWTRGNALHLSPGDYVFNVWMREDGASIDMIGLTTDLFNPPSEPEACQENCTPCTPTTTETCVDPGDEWPECGVGAGRHCCPYADANVCVPLSTQCNSIEPDYALGETWSKPVVGKVRVGGSEKWLAFFASGYSNRPDQPYVGQSLYAVDIESGGLLGRWDFGDVSDGPNNPSTLENAVPAGPALADADNDNYVDRVYIGDLEGRMWKVDVSSNGTIDSTTGRIDTWPSCVLFDAGNPTGSSTRVWAPVITTPAVAVLNGSPYVYFGTGGDDRAPDDVGYRFYGIRDTDLNGSCMSSPRREDDLDLDHTEGSYDWIVDGPPGLKYWADPVLYYWRVIFTGLSGDIDTTNPCSSAGGITDIYAIAIRPATVGGDALQPGDSALTRVDGESARPASRRLNYRVREAALVRGQEIPDGWARAGLDYGDESKTEVIFQGFSEVNTDASGTTNDGDDESLQAPIFRLVKEGVLDPEDSLNQNRFRILRWREVPLE